MKTKIVIISPNTRFAWEKGKGGFGADKVILNDTEFDIIEHQKEKEEWEAELIDGKYKLLKKIK